MVVGKVNHCKAEERRRMKENSISSFPSSFWRAGGLCYYLINGIIAFFNQRLTSSLANTSCPRVISRCDYLQRLLSWLRLQHLCFIAVLLLSPRSGAPRPCSTPSPLDAKQDGVSGGHFWGALKAFALPQCNRNPLWVKTDFHLICQSVLSLNDVLLLI